MQNNRTSSIPTQEEIAAAMNVLAKSQAAEATPELNDSLNQGGTTPPAIEQATAAEPIPAAEQIPTQRDQQTAPDTDTINQKEAVADNPSDYPNGEQEGTSIDVALVNELFTMLTSATKSKFYMSNAKRVKTLIDALEIPVSDDRSFQGFYNHSKKDLEGAAYRTARKNKTQPAEVTTAEIMTEAHRRYFAKHNTKAIVNEEYEV